MHVVSNHQAGKVVFLHDFLCQLKNLIRCCRVKCSCVLIEQQDLGRDKCRHQKRQCLPLSSGQESYRLLHAILQPHMQKGEPFAEHFPVGIAWP